MFPIFHTADTGGKGAEDADQAVLVPFADYINEADYSTEADGNTRTANCANYFNQAEMTYTFIATRNIAAGEEVSN